MKFFDHELAEHGGFASFRTADWYVLVQQYRVQRSATLHVHGTDISAVGSTYEEALRKLEEQVRLLRTKLEGVTRP